MTDLALKIDRPNRGLLSRIDFIRRELEDIQHQADNTSNGRINAALKEELSGIQRRFADLQRAVEDAVNAQRPKELVSPRHDVADMKANAAPSSSGTPPSEPPPTPGIGQAPRQTPVPDAGLHSNVAGTGGPIVLVTRQSSYSPQVHAIEGRLHIKRSLRAWMGPVALCAPKAFVKIDPCVAAVGEHKELCQTKVVALDDPLGALDAQIENEERTRSGIQQYVNEIVGLIPGWFGQALSWGASGTAVTNSDSRLT